MPFPVVGREGLQRQNCTDSRFQEQDASSVFSAVFSVEVIGAERLQVVELRRCCADDAPMTPSRCRRERQHPSKEISMSGALLEVLATLYHNPDPNAKSQASEWLEAWQLKAEAWNVADSVLHSTVRNVEVLFFCSQTLVCKVRTCVSKILSTGALDSTGF